MLGLGMNCMNFLLVPTLVLYIVSGATVARDGFVDGGGGLNWILVDVGGDIIMLFDLGGLKRVSRNPGGLLVVFLFVGFLVGRDLIGSGRIAGDATNLV
ncbi:uncharacterized protein DS421_7g212730 [Arachis hypogaea]|nr:uncharacterized protein DS421_7g212730 [Arachis hypogaea]